MIIYLFKLNVTIIGYLSQILRQYPFNLTV